MKLFNTNLNNNSARIAVCVPCRDMLHSMFTYSLVQMIQWSHSSNQIVSVFMDTGTIISRQRQSLAQNALANGFTHILWLDSDMTFPPNTCELLLAHNKEIVACNYSTRTLPKKGVAYKQFGDWNSDTEVIQSANRLEEVDAVGMGCMLVKSSIFDNLALPWFDISWNEQFNDFLGEDFYFCTKCKTKGYKIYIDTHTSQKIQHVGTACYTLSANK